MRVNFEKKLYDLIYKYFAYIVFKKHVKTLVDLDGTEYCLVKP